MQKMSLDALAREHLERAHRSEAGRSAETVYGGHEHVLRQTVVALTAGTTLAEHENPGEATVHVLSGRIRLRAGADSWDGRDGDLIIIPTARHELEARTDAVVLLTVAKSLGAHPHQLGPERRKAMTGVRRDSVGARDRCAR